MTPAPDYRDISDDSLYDVADHQQTGAQLGYPEMTPEIAGRLLAERAKSPMQTSRSGRLFIACREAMQRLMR